MVRGMGCSRKATGPLDGTVCDYFWITTKCKAADNGRGRGRNELYAWYSSTDDSPLQPPSLASHDRKLFLRVPTTGKSLFLKILSVFSTPWPLCHADVSPRAVPRPWGVNPSPGKISLLFTARFPCPFCTMSFDFRRSPRFSRTDCHRSPLKVDTRKGFAWLLGRVVPIITWIVKERFLAFFLSLVWLREHGLFGEISDIYCYFRIVCFSGGIVREVIEIVGIYY